jgi:AcrR family transcriptional regulator
VLDKQTPANEVSFMPTPPITTAAPSGLRRRILDAALELFEQRTYAATNVPDIAARAGVAVGSIYRHFPNKEALGSAVFAEAKAQFADEVLTDEVRTATPLDALRLIWRNQLAYATRQPTAFSFLEHQLHAGYLDADARAVVEGLDRALVAILEAAQRDGTVRQGDPGVLLSMVFGAFVGVTRHSRATGKPLSDYDWETIRRAAADLLALPPLEP